MALLCLPQTKLPPHIQIDLMPDEVLQYKLGRLQKQGQAVRIEMQRKRKLSVWYRGIC